MDQNLFGGDAPLLDHPINLGNDNSSGVVDRSGHLELLNIHGLVLNGQVARLIPIGRPNKADINGEGRIKQALFAAQFHQRNHLFPGVPGPLVGLAAAISRVGKGPQSRGSNGAGKASRNGPEELHQVSQRQHKAGHPFLLNQFPQAWIISHVGENEFLEHARPFRQMTHPPALSIPLAGTLHQRHIFGMSSLVIVSGQGHDQVLWAAEPVEARGGQRTAILHKRRCLGRGDDLAHVIPSPLLSAPNPLEARQSLFSPYYSMVFSGSKQRVWFSPLFELFSCIGPGQLVY